jgi:hypothetical protein
LYFLRLLLPSSDPLAEDTMIRRVILALSLVLAAPLAAQTPPQQPPAARPGIPPEMRERFQTARQACVAEVKPRDLPRGERRKAMRTCLEAKMPEAAPIFARGEARRAEMRKLRDDCRQEVRPRRLARDERRQAMQACMVQKKPELAKVFSCRDEAASKNMAPGAERRDFMRSCIRG